MPFWQQGDHVVKEKEGLAEQPVGRMWEALLAFTYNEIHITEPCVHFSGTWYIHSVVRLPPLSRVSFEPK